MFASKIDDELSHRTQDNKYHGHESITFLFVIYYTQFIAQNTTKQWQKDVRYGIKRIHEAEVELCCLLTINRREIVHDVLFHKCW